MDGCAGDTTVSEMTAGVPRKLMTLLGLGSIIVFTATVFALLQGIRNGSTAVVIVQAGIFAEASRQLVRSVWLKGLPICWQYLIAKIFRVAAQLELDFNSIERIVEYLDIPQEAPAVIEKSDPPAYWPSADGEIHVENLSVQYAPHLPLALRNVSFVVKASEKIGVVSATPYAST